jgi:hypothetical protein
MPAGGPTTNGNDAPNCAPLANTAPMIVGQSVAERCSGTEGRKGGRRNLRADVDSAFRWRFFEAGGNRLEGEPNSRSQRVDRRFTFSDDGTSKTSAGFKLQTSGIAVTITNVCPAAAPKNVQVRGDVELDHDFRRKLCPSLHAPAMSGARK